MVGPFLIFFTIAFVPISTSTFTRQIDLQFLIRLLSLSLFCIKVSYNRELLFVSSIVRRDRKSNLTSLPTNYQSLAKKKKIKLFGESVIPRGFVIFKSRKDFKRFRVR